MKVLITGSRGFIGSHLADALEEKGHEVVHYDLKDGNDVLDLEKMRKMGRGVDGIVDFAAVQRVITGYNNPLMTIDTNINGLKNVLDVATENKAFVLFGSSKTVYGNSETLPVKENDPKNPTNIYSLTKLVSEMIIKDFCKNYNMKAAVVRFSSIFGSERDILDRAIPTFMYKSINNIDLTIQDPERTLDPTFIDDIIPCLVRLVEKLDKEEPGYYDSFNMASGNDVKIKDIVSTILEITNSKAKIVGTTGSRSYDFGGFVGDPTKIKQTLGFKETDFKNALKIYHKRFLDALENDKFKQEDIDFMLNYFNRK